MKTLLLSITAIIVCSMAQASNSTAADVALEVQPFIGTYTGIDSDEETPCTVEVAWIEPDQKLSIKINNRNPIESEPQIQNSQFHGRILFTSETRDGDGENYERALLYQTRNGLKAVRTVTNEIADKTRVMSSCEELQRK